MSPDRDAFGRPIVPPGHRPATGLESGWPPPGGPQGPSGRIAGALALVVLLLGVLGLVLTDTIDLGGDDRSDSAAVADTSSSTGDDPDAEADDADAIGSGGEPSQFSTDDAVWALDQLKTEQRPGERIVSLTMYADETRVVTTAGRDQAPRVLTLNSDGTIDEEVSGDLRSPGVELDRIDERASQRLLAAVERGLDRGFSVNKVHYASSDRDDEPAGWTATIQPATDRDAPAEQRWRGDLHGRHVLRLGDGAPAPAPGRPGPAKRPAGSNRASLLREGNLRQALAAASSAAADTRVVGVDLRPKRAVVTVRDGFHKRRFTVDAAFGVGPDSGATSPEKGSVSFATIDPAGPERALARISQQIGESAAARIDRLTLDPRNPGRPDLRSIWHVYLKGQDPINSHWRATLDGSRVGRPGEDDAP